MHRQRIIDIFVQVATGWQTEYEIERISELPNEISENDKFSEIISVIYHATYLRSLTIGQTTFGSFPLYKLIKELDFDSTLENFFTKCGKKTFVWMLQELKFYQDNVLECLKAKWTYYYVIQILEKNVKIIFNAICQFNLNPTRYKIIYNQLITLIDSMAIEVNTLSKPGLLYMKKFHQQLHHKNVL